MCISLTASKWDSVALAGNALFNHFKQFIYITVSIAFTMLKKKPKHSEVALRVLSSFSDLFHLHHFCNDKDSHWYLSYHLVQIIQWGQGKEEA